MTARLLGIIIAAGLAFAAGQDEKSGPVRTKEPTVVTVEGKADRVEEAERRPRGAGARVVRGLKSVWNGVVGFGGWLLNANDDVPSRRDREAAERRKQQQ